MTANHESYLLMASTQNDMEDWVKSIRRVIWGPFGGGIFGQKLEDTVRYEKRYGNHLAPMLVEQCVDFIRQRGLKEEGLFRLPGQANLVKELQDAFDCGEKPSFDSTDVHTVASLLKLYLRELPEPVIPYAKYEDFLSCAKLLSKEEEAGVKELAKQVKSLPVVNYNLLKYICRFLDEVQSYSGVNKMSVQNLATVFGPNILRPKVEDPLTIMEEHFRGQHCRVVEEAAVYRTSSPCVCWFKFPAAPLWIQLSSEAWEGSGKLPKSLGPCTQVGDPEKAPGSGFGLAQLQPLQPSGE